MPSDPSVFFQNIPVDVIVTSPWFLAFKFICAVISIFLVLHIIHLIMQIRAVKLAQNAKKGVRQEEKTMLPATKNEFQMLWNGIRARMNTQREADWKLSIIEADKLLDATLRHLGYKGKDMGERLKQITSEELSGIEDIWQAHKARNRLSHDISYHVNLSEAQWIIDTYEEAFKEMKLLDPEVGIK